MRRLVGSFNAVPIRRAIQGRRDGERMLIVGQDLLRDIGVAEGDTVAVELRPDPEPDRVEIPEELAATLDLDPDAAARFAALTAGRRRDIVLHISQGKRSETRVKRALDVARKLRTQAL